MLEGKVALITGANRGLGKEISLALAKRGASIAIHYFKNRNLAESLKKQIGKNAEIYHADLMDEKEIFELVRRISAEMGEIDILINNFGPFIYKKWEEISFEEWDYIIRGNLNSAFICSKAVIPGMRRKKWGRIINIGYNRVEQIVAFPNITPYAIAKTGLLILTRTMAKTEAPYKITVNMVSPGLMEEGIKPEEFEIPMGRYCSFEDVIEAIIFLISDGANYITGTNIIVGGGWKI
ncbi:SDR family oxidoreductase [Candidatus Aminicenantes bacterium AC-335-K20]|nr:SDR family oxidoreductase [SCandidatus Aminicenantes bacterium Aminicenantia_JdfR_composite]MCP2598334.1 SDR family oxidoreductase [Candidatus Aminicenantes bacterium AC-335-L06]MCP2606056.1 SDR family oxidoreductase [Candidatus Aminicenantes bacterium AC-708-I09]MCP2618389.1 SDR family oxidoreductase [Candidatus Aminicenantes bacterium AC-335-A11]MCP2619385.1 SDR family oxidoreductase [Candidatus Aminicenantes bacterium AC-335-K20]MCP2620594.1 SDR family oxidoreductase [Candidatus Aminicen